MASALCCVSVDAKLRAVRAIASEVIADAAKARERCELCGNQRFEAAPFRGEVMLFRRHFLDARRGGAERIRLVQAGAESVTTRPT